MHALQALHPVDDKMRVLDLRVTAPGRQALRLQVPWDRTPFDLEPLLVSGTPLDQDGRTTHAASSFGDDVLDLALGKALRHAENPDGAATLALHVEADGGALEFTVECSGVSEPEPHQPYPRVVGPASAPLSALLAGDEADWFCDGSSTLSCCAAHRETPQQLDWVVL